MDRKRSLGKKDNPIDSKKRTSVYNYIKKSVESLDLATSENASVSIEKIISDNHNSNIRDTKKAKSKRQLTKKPKISKPTKTITMSITEDGNGKICKTENSLRNSKESISFRGSITSKKTPKHDSDSVKMNGLSTTKPHTLSNSDKTKNLGSYNSTAEASKNDKEKQSMLKNSRSQK